MTVDEFNKVTLALVALIAAVVGPLLQWYIAHRQSRLQEGIATRQANLQEQIAKRHVADSIASKRQGWIDGLRSEFAEMLVEYSTVLLKYSHEEFDDASDEKKQELTAEAETSRRRAYELSICLELRLSSEDPFHADLSNAIHGLQEIVRDAGDEADEDLMEKWKIARGKAVDAASRVLEREWAKVKAGDV